jgi:hypothetical protein
LTVGTAVALSASGKVIEMTGTQVTQDDVRKVRRTGRLLLVVSVVTLMVGIGGFGTASAGEVEMFGVTLEAKYACFIYFLLGAACLWSALEARKRGFK